MAAWPETLPTGISEGYSLSPADHTVRSEMDSGAARVRKRSIARNDIVGVDWVMNLSEFSAFRAWFIDASGADYGAAWFTLPLRTGWGDAAMVQTQTARFAGPWSASAYMGQYWRVNAKLEVRDA